MECVSGKHRVQCPSSPLDHLLDKLLSNDVKQCLSFYRTFFEDPVVRGAPVRGG